jgi:hypothetical protein
MEVLLIRASVLDRVSSSREGTIPGPQIHASHAPVTILIHRVVDVTGILVALWYSQMNANTSAIGKTDGKDQ